MNLLHWLMPWEFSWIVLLATAFTAGLFVCSKEERAWNPGRLCCFWFGLVLFYMTLHTRLDLYAEHAFFIHQLQHSTLQHFAPMLIALSNPWNRLGHRLPPLPVWLRFADYPSLALLQFLAVTALWLLPPMHFIAMIDWRFYRLMNESYVLSGLWFWAAMLNRNGKSAPRIALLIASIPPQIALGALLCFSTQDFYPVYRICGRIFASLTPLADQQLGGLILWIHGAMMAVIGILIVVWRDWLPNRRTAT